MSSRRTFVVACLAGQGIGPEVTAAASRALAQVSRQHGFRVEELHVPFGGDAVRRFGHPLPSFTRAACAEADAVLVASIFHYGEHTIREAKEHMDGRGVSVRL